MTVRSPAVAGSFYPGSQSELAATVERLLASRGISVDKAHLGAVEKLPSNRTGAGDNAAHVGAAEIAHRSLGTACPRALIVPHAGYVYSGAIAAAAFARIAPFADQIRRVVLIGPAHRKFVDGLATPGVDAMATPLGEVVVDRAASEFPRDAAAHAREHSLEVMLPFLQTIVPHATIVPLIGGRATPAQVGQTLEQLWTDDTLILISSDLSHFLSYDDGRAKDRATCTKVLALDTDLEGDQACGAIGINGLAWLARKSGLAGELIELKSSGDVVDRDEVVGYGAFAFYEQPRAEGA